MAKITFSLEELLKDLISNELLPPQIIRARVKGQRGHFVIRTDSFFFENIEFTIVSEKHLTELLHTIKKIQPFSGFSVGRF